MLPIVLVAYLVLFIAVGVLFLFVSLLIGRFIRPAAPSQAKGEAYECGEPAVGSSFIQFDLRFYVVALLFIIFEVELAFFFPPAVVFGKLNQLRSPSFGRKFESSAVDTPLQLTPPAREKFAELGIPAESVEGLATDASGNIVPANTAGRRLDADLQTLSLMAMLDIGVFFVVLLVGFAFLWKQGDLNWIRAVARPSAEKNIKLALLPQAGEGR
ncbi:MAG: NADH-quinone oxidoreductase subunit A [Pirellulales bacterium]|nr:NADH-quinone oxidoreductase subunit A [Pirellulales bacterium]